MKVGGESTRLIVLRGNSGSGKSSVAAEIRARHGRGIALVGQDNLRRVVLREGDVPGAANIGLIDTVARYALGHGFHVIIDGILRATTYGAMLDALHHDHQGTSRFYYFDVPFDETMRRHAARPQATEFGRDEMSGWYRELDLLPSGIEQIIPAASSLDATVLQIIRDVGPTHGAGRVRRARGYHPQVVLGWVATPSAPNGVSPAAGFATTRFPPRCRLWPATQARRPMWWTGPSPKQPGWPERLPRCSP